MQPGSAVALNDLAIALEESGKARRTQGDWPGVVKALEKAIALRPAFSQYYYILSTAYRKRGKIEEREKALAAFRQLERQTGDLEERLRQARRATYGMEFRSD